MISYFVGCELPADRQQQKAGDACVQDAMQTAQALQVKAQQDVSSCTAAVEEAGRKLQSARQEAAESAEAAWRRQLAEHEAAVREEQEAYQAQQVTHPDTHAQPVNDTFGLTGGTDQAD